MTGSDDSASHASPATASTTCFVIGPIGDEHAPIGSPERDRYENSLYAMERIILPACERFGIVPLRADLIARMGEIPEQVFVALRDRDLVIADLTNANPNVMYELALRHSTGRCVILISEYGKLPFDVSWVRTIVFTRTPLGLVEGRQRVEAAIQAFLDDGCDRITATRIMREDFPMTSGGPPSPSEPRDDDGPIHADDGPGFVDMVADLESAFPQVNAIIHAVTAEIEQAGNLAEESAAAITEQGRSDPSFAARLPIIARYAVSLDASAARLDTLAHDYAENINIMDPGMGVLLDRLAEDPALSGEAPEFLPSLVTMGATARESFDSGLNLAATIEGLAPLARTLRNPARRYGRALRSLAEVSAPVQRWADRASELLGESA
jgi:hypothetical protein